MVHGYVSQEADYRSSQRCKQNAHKGADPLRAYFHHSVTF